jgi:biopolymer transport protein ExbB/TolQ
MMANVKRAPVTGILIGGVLWIFAPIAGLCVTIGLLLRAFSLVALVDPASKARVLAEAISEAMNCTAVGIALGVAGMILALACVPWLARAPRAGPRA